MPSLLIREISEDAKRALAVRATKNNRSQQAETNVISETFKKHPDEHTMNWMECNVSNIFLSTITLEELRFGERLLPSGHRYREPV